MVSLGLFGESIIILGDLNMADGWNFMLHIAGWAIGGGIVAMIVGASIASLFNSDSDATSKFFGSLGVLAGVVTGLIKHF